jgi:GTP-binding protein HflX
MTDLFDTSKPPERAILVTVTLPGQSEDTTREYLDELAFLATTLGVETLKKVRQNLPKPDIRTFVGKGKLEEIKEYLAATEADVVIFDDDLSPSQLRNLERELKVKIYDRSLLILDIFLKRAQTSQAKTQVELARYQYLLPRLTRMWTHLERQRGGTGTRGGAGEKEIETDRRMIRNQINVLKEKLKKIEQQSITQRKGRESQVRVALVGYTNVGKSTLMNLLTKADVYAEDKLFATVDATVRKVVFDGIPFLLSDTVGFIRKLPTHLIESFKSTLNEVIEADVLMHVVDVSHPAMHDQIRVVNETLSGIKAGEKPTLLIFNKVDAAVRETDEEMESYLQSLREYYQTDGETEVLFISAVKKEGIEEMRKVLMKYVKQRYLQIYPNYVQPEIFRPESDSQGSIAFPPLKNGGGVFKIPNSA